MIVSRAPVRFSLGGGGTDLPAYAKRFGGFVVAAAIDKYLYVTANKRFHTDIRLAYSKTEIVPVRREIPGDPSDTQSRYLEAAVNGVLVGCLYLPNGNPQPGPKFEYKLAWFERLIAHAATLVDNGVPVILAGDYNVVPTDEDIYDPKSWKKDALLSPKP